MQDLQSPERTATLREALEQDGFVVLRDVVRKDRLQELADEICTPSSTGQRPPASCSRAAAS